MSIDHSVNEAVQYFDNVHTVVNRYRGTFSEKRNTLLDNLSRYCSHMKNKLESGEINLSEYVPNTDLSDALEGKDELFRCLVYEINNLFFSTRKSSQHFEGNTCYKVDPNNLESFEKVECKGPDKAFNGDYLIKVMDELIDRAEKNSRYLKDFSWDNLELHPKAHMVKYKQTSSLPK